MKTFTMVYQRKEDLKMYAVGTNDLLMAFADVMDMEKEGLITRWRIVQNEGPNVDENGKVSYSGRPIAQSPDWLNGGQE